MASEKPERSGSDKAISDRAAALRSKLSAKSRDGLSRWLEDELVDLFDDIVNGAPVDPGERSLGSIVGGGEEAAGVFRRRNVELDFVTTYEAWVQVDSEQPYIDMRTALGKVRVVGECWGMSRLAHPVQGGGLLYTDVSRTAKRKVEWVDGGRAAVRCHLGTTFEDVATFLRDTGKCLPNQPGFKSLTVAGVVGTGGHGSSLRLGSLASSVRRMEIGGIGSGAAKTTYVRGAGPVDFDTAVTHLGRLGPVLNLDLDVVDAFRIAETRRIRRLRAAGFGALLAEATAEQERADVHSVEIWIAPYADRQGDFTVAYGKRAFTTAPVSGRRPAALRSRVLQGLGRMIANLIGALDKSWIKPILRQTVRLTKEDEPVVMEAADGLDFGAPNDNPMMSIEMAVPLGRGAEAVALLLETLERLARSDVYVFSPIGLRFVGAGAETGLSPQAGNAATLHIEIPTFRGDVLGGAAALKSLQMELATKLRARPHWGQRVVLDAGTLASLWPRSSRRALEEHARVVDPNGVFASPLLDDMLALP